MGSNNRKMNYRRLRIAGFNSHEANKFKDYGDQDEFYQQQVIRMQTLKWLLDDIEALEDKDNE